MTVYSLGQVSGEYNEAHTIDSNYFASVVIGNLNAVTLGSEREDSFSDAISYLGVTAIRWPGGSEAERDFDWRSDASSTHTLDVSDLRTAIDYCAENGLNFSFTFPTSEFKGMSDNELNDLDEQISTFIVDELIAYADQKNVIIDSIKIGNEYDLNGLSAAEYGQIASRLSLIIGESLDQYGSSHIGWGEPKLVVESGRIWLQESGSGLFFGDRDHNGLMDAQEIKEAFDTIEAGYVDAVDIHSLTLFLSSNRDYFGQGPYSNANLNTIYRSLNSFWDDTFQDVELHTLAWQYPWQRDIDGPQGPGGVEDHGGSALVNASLGFMQYYEMSLGGVDYAVSWLASGWGGASPTLFHNEPRAGGELFRLMQENISGLRAIEFDQDPTVFQNGDGIEDVVFRAFEQEGKVVLYIGNLETESQTITIDDVLPFLEGVDGFGGFLNLNTTENLHIWGSRLGVDGDPNNYSSMPVIDIYNHIDLFGASKGFGALEFELGAYEIMQLTFTSRNHDLVEISGHDGNDTLIGSTWNDELFGMGGDDTIYGGTGNDAIYGDSGNDELRGDAGNDNISGGLGADLVIGGTGNDVISGGAYGDEMFGGDGFDFINGGFGNDRLNGGEGGDKFFHLGIADHGSDWIQDYNSVEGDVLLWGGGNATASDFLVQHAFTDNAGDASVEEIFITHIPTGNLLWALVDGGEQPEINIQIGGEVYNLL